MQAVESLQIVMTSLTAKPAVQPPLQPSPVLDRATWATLRADPALKDRQDKIGKILHIQMMDFNIYSPIKLETCVKKLIQLFYNILQNPDQEKYRKVKANNATFRKDILDSTKQGEELLLAAGWHTQVVQMERYWIFDAAKDSTTWQFLEYAHQQLQAAQSLTQQKAARHMKELEDRKTGPKKERELLLKQIEADRASRKDKFRPIISGPHTLDAALPSERGEPCQSPGSSPLASTEQAAVQ